MHDGLILKRPNINYGGGIECLQTNIKLTYCALASINHALVEGTGESKELFLMPLTPQNR